VKKLLWSVLLLSPLLTSCVDDLADGQVTSVETPAEYVAARTERQSQILFGDLHTHTSFSPDGFILGMPMTGGEGVRPPSDACDYARYCSAVDFWGISDHAEGVTPRLWSETRQSIRDCNAVANDPANPDLVSFLGFEWSHVGATPATHYGHKNVFFRDTEDSQVPARAIAAPREQLSKAPVSRGVQLALAALDFSNRDFYLGIQSYYDEIEGTPICERGVDSTQLPDNCLELAHNPGELFSKLDDWGFDALVIPHGNAWGLSTPLETTWDKQLSNSYQDPKYQKLIEIYSGHGNSEQYRDFKRVERDEEGNTSCPLPTEDFLPCCWRAGQLIKERCEDPASTACAARVTQARQDYVDNGISAHLTVPGASVEDWLNCGQCEDCFNPAFKLRPGVSSQYALTLNKPENEPGKQKFRFGFIGSSDNHRARAGNGFKDMGRRAGNTETMGSKSESSFTRKKHAGETTDKNSRLVADLGEIGLQELRNQERQQSFYLTGGLVAVHSEGRDRDSIWNALDNKQVYATSGDRILLWFDLLNAGGGEKAQTLPMGSEVGLDKTPRFKVSAAGAFKQNPGCPDYVAGALGADRQASLCANECYNPSDERKQITRIEVVRIQTQTHAGEKPSDLIEDPWLSLPCDSADGSCTVEFEDPEFVQDQREKIYYVRAIQEPTPAVNAGGLRCEYDEDGVCVAVNPCYGDFRTDPADDCQSPNEERAWSSPIYVNYSSGLE
jgi:hypothetical protein